MSTSPPDPPQDAPIQLFPAFCSMLLPGLGQLLQKRRGAGLLQIIFYFSIILLPCIGVGQFFYEVHSYWTNRFLFTLLLWIVPIIFIFFSVLDTLYWKPGTILTDKTSRFHTLFFILLFLSFPYYYLIDFSNPSARVSSGWQGGCCNQMQMIGIAMYNYDAHQGCFPPAYTIDSNGQPLHSWRVLILPYLEEENLYKQIRLEEPWDSEYNKQFHSQMPDIFRCPSMKQAGSVFSAMKEQYHHLEIGCCYSIVIGKETPFPGSESTQPESIGDEENTVLIVERMVPVNWMNPMSDMSFETASCGVNVELTGIGSAHCGGCNCAMADGGVKFIVDTLEPDKLKEMLKTKKDKYP